MPYIFPMSLDLPSRSSQTSDNNDYCAACGGPGYLLCCDGCNRSFHFTCLDPPYREDARFDSDWFCSICEAKREPSRHLHQGLFADLRAVLDKNNPRSFALPETIRSFFKDVKTGANGEYLTGVEQRPT